MTSSLLPLRISSLRTPLASVVSGKRTIQHASSRKLPSPSFGRKWMVAQPLEHFQRNHRYGPLTCSASVLDSDLVVPNSERESGTIALDLTHPLAGDGSESTISSHASIVDIESASQGILGELQESSLQAVFQAEHEYNRALRNLQAARSKLESTRMVAAELHGIPVDTSGNSILEFTMAGSNQNSRGEAAYWSLDADQLDGSAWPSSIEREMEVVGAEAELSARASRYRQTLKQAEQTLRERLSEAHVQSRVIDYHIEMLDQGGQYHVASWLIDEMSGACNGAELSSTPAPEPTATATCPTLDPTFCESLRLPVDMGLAACGYDDDAIKFLQHLPYGQVLKIQSVGHDLQLPNGKGVMVSPKFDEETTYSEDYNLRGVYASVTEGPRAVARTPYMGLLALPKQHQQQLLPLPPRLSPVPLLPAPRPSMPEVEKEDVSRLLVPGFGDDDDYQETEEEAAGPVPISQGLHMFLQAARAVFLLLLVCGASTTMALRSDAPSLARDVLVLALGSSIASAAAKAVGISSGRPASSSFSSRLEQLSSRPWILLRDGLRQALLLPYTSPAVGRNSGPEGGRCGLLSFLSPEVAPEGAGRRRDSRGQSVQATEEKWEQAIGNLGGLAALLSLSTLLALLLKLCIQTVHLLVRACSSLFPSSIPAAASHLSTATGSLMSYQALLPLTWTALGDVWGYMSRHLGPVAVWSVLAVCVASCILQMPCTLLLGTGRGDILPAAVSRSSSS